MSSNRLNPSRQRVGNMDKDGKRVALHDSKIACKIEQITLKTLENEMKTVLLQDHTVGTTQLQDVEIGDTVVVDLHDENGITIQVEGIVEEIL